MRDEGVSVDLFQNTYGDLPMIHPLASTRLLHHQNTQSDFNWPVFPRREESLSQNLDTAEKQRNSTMNTEATGIKRDHTEIRSDERVSEDGMNEEKKSCDRLSLIANIALKEMNTKEE